MSFYTKEHFLSSHIAYSIEEPWKEKKDVLRKSKVFLFDLMDIQKMYLATRRMRCSPPARAPSGQHSPHTWSGRSLTHKWFSAVLLYSTIL